MRLSPLPFALLLLAASAPAATPTPADSAMKRVQDALEVKSRLEKAVHEKLVAGATAPDAHAAPTATGAPAATAHAAGAAGRHAPPPAAVATADVWADLLAGNRRFIAGQPRARALVQQRAALASGQHPRAIVLACADSRVGPELLFDQTLGDLFVVRVAGNVTDSVGIGSIEYAVEHLHARTIVVLGHTACGAVRAAAAGGDPGSPNLVALVAHIEPVLRRLSNCFEGDELTERAIAANAKQSAAELLANSALLRHAKEADGLRVVAAVYDIETGFVKELR